MASYSEIRSIGSIIDLHPPTANTKKLHLPENSLVLNKHKFFPEYDYGIIEASPKRKAFVDATVKVFEYLYNSVTDVREIFGPQECPETLLKYHAQLLGFEQIDFSFNFRTFRDLVMNLVNIYKIKGTQTSYDIFFQSIGYDVLFINFWYNQDGELVRTRPPGAPSRLYDNYHNNRSNIIRVILEPRLVDGVTPEINVDAEFITIITTYLKFLKPAHIYQEAIEIVVPPIGGDIIEPPSTGAGQILVTSITVSTASGLSTITVDGGTRQMIATVLPVNATNNTVTWQVFPGTGVATIQQNGLLTAFANGTVTARATANDGSGIYGEKVITISNQTAVIIPITSIVLTPDGGIPEITANAGTLQILADILPVNATIQDLNWSVTNVTGEATINQSGLLTAAGGLSANGTVIVRADAIDGSGIFGELIVTISNQVDIPGPCEPDPGGMYDNYPPADLVCPPVDNFGQYVFNPLYQLWFFAESNTSSFSPTVLLDDYHRSIASSGGTFHGYPETDEVSIGVANNKMLIVLNDTDSFNITLSSGNLTITNIATQINTQTGRNIATKITTANGSPVLRLIGKNSVDGAANIELKTVSNSTYSILGLTVGKKYIQGLRQNPNATTVDPGEDYVKMFDTLVLSALARVTETDTFYFKIGRGFRIGGEFVQLTDIDGDLIPTIVHKGPVPVIGGAFTGTDTLTINPIVTIELEDTLDTLSIGSPIVGIGGGITIGGTGTISDELVITDSDFVLGNPGDVIGAELDNDSLD